MLQETIEDVEVTVSRSVELFQKFKQLPESQKFIFVAVLYAVGTAGFCVSLMLPDKDVVLTYVYLVELLWGNCVLFLDADILEHLDPCLLYPTLHKERRFTQIHAHKAAKTVH